MRFRKFRQILNLDDLQQILKFQMRKSENQIKYKLVNRRQAEVYKD